ncbi:MAG TPA: sensor domain-containing diguanylate cyclase, partial [Spongiibacteraceae bacterium]|nr:sensor domain-containing diguanylate cyclase [Spongiibacteraceae bacterium]
MRNTQSAQSALQAKPHAKQGFLRFLDPHSLLPATALLILFLIWGSTYQLIKVARANAEHNATVLTRDLADLYETQVLRALREIDQTLKIVKYAFEKSGDPAVLAELKSEDMLLYDSLFTVSITDTAGTVVATTHADDPRVHDDDLLQQQHNSTTMIVGTPHRDANGEWWLHFSRPLQTQHGAFAGFVWIAVSADYFVSDYNDDKLGRHGVLALLGTDGIFRARRSGASIDAGGQVNYASMLSTFGNKIQVGTNRWDNVRRYTTLHPLFGFPVSVLVGVSEIDQHITAQAETNYYLKDAGITTAVSAAMLILLWQVFRYRKLVMEERLARAKQVEFLAYHDGLTSLPNRMQLNVLLPNMLAQAQRYNYRASVIFLDLDGFKQVNDTGGHDAGDLLLQHVATRLTNCLRHSDIVARVGGDEFVVLLPEIKNENQVRAVSHKMLAAIAQPYRIMNSEFHVTASVGVAIFPQDGLDAQSLEKNAD